MTDMKQQWILPMEHKYDFNMACKLSKPSDLCDNGGVKITGHNKIETDSSGNSVIRMNYNVEIDTKDPAI